MNRIHDTVAEARDNYDDAVDDRYPNTWYGVGKKSKPKLRYGQPIYILEWSKETRRKEVTELRLYKYDKDNFYCVRDNGVRTTVNVFDAYTDRAEAEKNITRRDKL